MPERRPERRPDPERRPAGHGAERDETPGANAKGPATASVSGPLHVAASEAGQKVLQFLQRRLGTLPQSMLHRWIRSGQVRRNGGRVKAFDRLDAGDEIRLPPFALICRADADSTPVPGDDRSVPPALSADQPRQRGAELPPLVAETQDLLVFCKPAGLAVHPGSGLDDSLTTRLARHFAHVPFLPTPAHRLDKETSGLLLVARSYAALRALHEALAQREGVEKEYLAWVHGRCLWTSPVLLCDRLDKRADSTGFERVRHVDRRAGALHDLPLLAESEGPAGLQSALTLCAAGDAANDAPERKAPQNNAIPETSPTEHHAPENSPQKSLANAARREASRNDGPGNDTPGKEARLLARCVEIRNGYSLLHLRLLTGRTHQIRAQLAQRGFPIVGDTKYGALPGQRPARQSLPVPRGLHLHACRIRLQLPDSPHAEAEDAASDWRNAVYEALPLWSGPLAVTTLPPAWQRLTEA